MKLFFDTETTGRTDFRQPENPEAQPRIVQLGALLTDDEGNERASLDVIIRPDGWTIPADAVAIHGITDEKAQACGIPITAALVVFGQLLECADLLVAHNIDFDHLVTKAEYARLGAKAAAGLERLIKANQFCTMHASTDVCRIQGMRGYKWPKLTEAHRHFFGTDVEGAHDAMTDVRACKRIYFELLRVGQAQPQEALA